jgi:hypothetical protein
MYLYLKSRLYVYKMFKRLFLVLIYALSVTCSQLDMFMNRHLISGSHTHPDVPHHIRGENFTHDNLEKYFDVFQKNYSYHVHTHPRRSLTQAVLAMDDVVAIGKQAWTFIEENKPVLNVNTDYAGAIPKSVTDWTRMAGWKNSARGPFTISLVNGFGSEVVHVDFRWSHSYGGNYNGKGEYVTQAGPVVGRISVSWGYTVDVAVQAFQPLNVGTVIDPISQIDVSIKSTTSTVLKDTVQNCRARFIGDGSINIVNCDMNML